MAAAMDTDMYMYMDIDDDVDTVAFAFDVAALRALGEHAASPVFRASPHVDAGALASALQGHPPPDTLSGDSFGRIPSAHRVAWLQAAHAAAEAVPEGHRACYSCDTCRVALSFGTWRLACRQTNQDFCSQCVTPEDAADARFVAHHGFVGGSLLDWVPLYVDDAGDDADADAADDEDEDEDDDDKDDASTALCVCCTPAADRAGWAGRFAVVSVSKFSGKVALLPPGMSLDAVLTAARARRATAVAHKENVLPRATLLDYVKRRFDEDDIESMW